MREDVQNVIKGSNFTYRVALRNTNVKYINAYGSFVDKHKIKVSQIIWTFYWKLVFSNANDGHYFDLNLSYESWTQFHPILLFSFLIFSFRSCPLFFSPLLSSLFFFLIFSFSQSHLYNHLCDHHHHHHHHHVPLFSSSIRMVKSLFWLQKTFS